MSETPETYSGQKSIAETLKELPLGELLQTIRTQIGLSPSQLALHSLFATRQTINNIESEKVYAPEAKTIGSIIDGLGLRYADERAILLRQKAQEGREKLRARKSQRFQK